MHSGLGAPELSVFGPKDAGTGLSGGGGGGGREARGLGLTSEARRVVSVPAGCPRRPAFLILFSSPALPPSCPVPEAFDRLL